MSNQGRSYGLPNSPIDKEEDYDDAMDTSRGEGSGPSGTNNPPPLETTPHDQTPSNTNAPPTVLPDATQQLLIQLIQQLARENPTSRCKPKAADAEFFTGERSKFSDFEMQVRLKLQADHDIYSTNDEKVAYVIGRLRGDPQRWAWPFYDTKYTPQLTPLLTFEDFMTSLCWAYGDPDEGTAERDIQRIRQKGRPLSTYWAELEQLATILKINSEVTKVHFLNGVDEYLYEWLTYQVGSENWDLETLVNQCIRYDNNIHPMPPLFRTAGSPSSSSNTPRTSGPPYYSGQRNSYVLQPKPQPQPQTTSPRNHQQSSSQPQPPRNFAQAAGQGYYGPMSMEIGNTGPRGKVPPHERARRFNEGGCFRCGEVGHFAVNCPLKDRPRPQTP